MGARGRSTCVTKSVNASGTEASGSESPGPESPGPESCVKSTV